MRIRRRDELEYGRRRDGYSFEVFIKASSRNWANGRLAHATIKFLGRHAVIYVLVRAMHSISGRSGGGGIS